MLFAEFFLISEGFSGLGQVSSTKICKTQVIKPVYNFKAAEWGGATWKRRNRHYWSLPKKRRRLAKNGFPPAWDSARQFLRVRRDDCRINYLVAIMIAMYPNSHMRGSNIVINIWEDVLFSSYSMCYTKPKGCSMLIKLSKSKACWCVHLRKSG